MNSGYSLARPIPPNAKFIKIENLYFCVNCVFHNYHESTVAHVCERKYKYEFDMVTGESKRVGGDLLDCKTERETGECGKQGKYFFRK